MSTDAVCPDVVRRKVAWRVVPLIFVLYVIAYLDRANVGFAKLRMQEELDWLTDSVYGWGSGFFFFAGYLLLEIPGALLVEHWSARKWFCRILLSWGAVSMAMAFVQSPWQFHLARFLLGLAEAGFFPGVIVYLTHWFPRADRGRALAGLVFGVPFSLALGSQMSDWIMVHNWLGVSGWQWVFLIEGAPAVLFGILVPFIMTDRPGDATWLTDAEREWLERTLQAERDEATKSGSATLGQALLQPSVWILSLGILATNTGGYAMGFWLPTFIDNMLKPAIAEAGDNLSKPTDALFYLGLFYFSGIVGVFVSGQSSDRTGERKWHCIAGQVGTGVFLALASQIPGQSFAMVMVWLCLMGFCAYFWPPPFWVLPTMSMSASAAAVSIGFINICANIAGLIGSTAVGEMKAVGYSDANCMLFGACCYAGGGVIIAFLNATPKPVIHEDHQDHQGDAPTIRRE